MLNAVLLLAYAGLPVLMWLLTRSLTWVATRLIFAFGVAGCGVQTAVSLGMNWGLAGLQLLALGLMLLVVVLAWLERSRDRAPLRRQVVMIVLPMIALGAFLIAMRLLAQDDPGPLSGFGYFINHPLAEDNAKWLNLSSQLAQNKELVFNGYAGGPLLLLMAIMATLIAVLSTIMFGGVNEVAVALNTVIGSQFLLIALVPIAFAPFAEGRVPRGPRRPEASGLFVPAPAVWAGMLVVAVASAVITSYGHLTLQFVLIVLVLWAAVFLIHGPATRTRLLMTLAIATSASVWLPLNILGLLLLGLVLVVSIARRDWWALALAVLTFVAVWDSLISSTLFLLGIDIGQATEPVKAGAPASDPNSAPAEVANATSLFEAPGGTEITEPLLGGLAIAALLLTVFVYSRVRPVRGWRAAIPFAPIVAMAGYLVALVLGDAVITGGSPHYGIHKMAFAVVVMTAGVAVPLAIVGLDPRTTGMTMLRWFAVGAVVVLLSLDTILPRGLSALSPVLWPGVDASRPVYWSAGEVRPVASQPISSLPLGCLYVPPVSTLPTALPEGQDVYTCTRMLVGLNGLEGHEGVLVEWLRTDWLSNSVNWDKYWDRIQYDEDDINGRNLIIINADGSLGGFTTLDSLLQRYPKTAS